jgi:hypothetical protein
MYPANWFDNISDALKQLSARPGFRLNCHDVGKDLPHFSLKRSAISRCAPPKSTFHALVEPSDR